MPCFSWTSPRIVIALQAYPLKGNHPYYIKKGASAPFFNKTKIHET